MLADGVHTLAYGHASITADVLVLDEPIGPVDVVLSAEQAGRIYIVPSDGIDPSKVTPRSTAQPQSSGPIFSYDEDDELLEIESE